MENYFSNVLHGKGYVLLHICNHIFCSFIYTNDNNLEQITWHFADNIFKCIFSIEIFCILIEIQVFPSDANDRKHGHFR